MARPLRIEYPNAFYHVLSRGNERKAIFIDPEGDPASFLRMLREACEHFRVRVHSYCLMPNHFHLLVQTCEANLSQFMKRLLGVYTLRFNRRHGRSGHLFQGRYKAILVEKESYLSELSRYIHLNPCRAGMVASPEEYDWSSMRYFLEPSGPPFLDKTILLSEFRSPSEYREFVLSGLSQKQDPLSKAIGGVILGREGFVNALRQNVTPRVDDGISRKRELLRSPKERWVTLLAGESTDVKRYLLWKVGRWTQREIGELFSTSHSMVSYAIRRFMKKLRHDPALLQYLRQVEDRLLKFEN